jgi:hypothetical protein
MTATTHATVVVTPTPQHVQASASGSSDVGIVVLVVIGAWLFGRVSQFFRDVGRGIGPKQKNKAD